MNSRYDVVVVGAGPAGLMAAREIARTGLDILLLEKHDRVGLPLCCAEAVSRVSFERLVETQKKWVSANIERVRLVATPGNDITLTHASAGYILDRPRFESDLARQAIEYGCDLQTKTIALELAGHDGKFESILVRKSNGNIKTIKASIFIAADGVESVIARKAGIDNRIVINEVESILQYRLENIEIDDDLIELHISGEIAPGGYAWVFPKSRYSANVGLGITVKDKRGELCRELLDRFIHRRFGQAKIAARFSGMTPKYMGRKMFLKDNLLVAGDAARALDSLTGAGIINAMQSGQDAGMTAVDFLQGRISSIEQIKDYYPRRFLDRKNDELTLYRKLRNIYIHMNDGDFDDVILALRKYFEDRPVEGVSPPKLLVEIIRTRPRLLRLVRYLI